MIPRRDARWPRSEHEAGQLRLPNTRPRFGPFGSFKAPTGTPTPLSWKY
jgi:hypothetical protein